MRVSICVPVYGVEKYIDRCARSLFEQTYEDIEYVFVDDCSHDNSILLLKEIINKYPSRKANVKIIGHAQNEGVAVARNTAIDNSTGEFLYFVDGDDYIEKETIACLVERQLNNSADIVTARMVINENEIDERFTEPIYNNKEEMLLTILSNVWHHELCNRLIRRSLFIDNNIKALPHVNICEDWQIVPQLVFYANKCVTIDSPFYHYVVNHNSITHSNTNWEKEKNGYMQEYQSLKVLIDFFKNTKYSLAINSLFLRRQADNIDLSIRNHDRVFFSQCREYILSVPNIHAISNFKIACIKMGYWATSFFLFMHNIKMNLKG